MRVLCMTVLGLVLALAGCGAADTEMDTSERREMTDRTTASCLSQLQAAGVTFERLDPIRGDGPCGAEQPLQVSAVRGVELSPSITTRCGLALSLSDWMRRSAQPAAERHLGARIARLRTASDYTCRATVGSTSRRWSEHAFANAVDISRVYLDDGRDVPVQARAGGPERDFQAQIRAGACDAFTTVIGPGANAAHADHFHFDMAQRRNGYRVCE